MIKFKSLLIKNFMSYGNNDTIIKLNSTGTTLIVGEDLDNTSGGVGANGVGKTSWINAITFGLYGKPISNISMDNLVNNVNKKDMRVEVEFEVDNTTILVRRARKEKGNGNYAKVFVREVGVALDEKLHDKTPDSVNNINDFIVSYLGLPFELFVRIVTFTATHTPFLDIPLRQQSEIMEELFGLTQLSVKAELLKKEIKSNKQSMEIKLSHNQQLEQEHKRHETLVSAANERMTRWEDEHNERVAATKALIKEQEQFPLSEQETLFKDIVKLHDNATVKSDLLRSHKEALREQTLIYDSLKQEIKRMAADKAIMTNKVNDFDIELLAKKNILKKTICELSSIDIVGQSKMHVELDKYNSDIDVLMVSCAANELELNTASDSVTELTTTVRHLKDAKCPYCKQDYAASKKKLTTAENDLKKNNIKIKKLKGLLKSERAKIDKIKKNKSVVENSILFTTQELITITSDLRHKKDELKSLEETINPFKEQLKTIETFDFNGNKKTLSSHENKISKINKNINKTNISLVELSNATEEAVDKLLIESESELYEIKHNLIKYKEQLSELLSDVNPHIEAANELKNTKIEPIDLTAINQLDKLINHQNYLLKLLTKKDSFVRKALLNKNLSFLNQQLHGYLNKLGLPHRVEFTQEMTANITQFGRNLDFGNLSSGQKARLNLALSFSFRDVLQQSNNSINICMLDEVLDVGLDGIGVQNAARMLKMKAREENLSLYIISHRDEVSNIFDDKIIVQMKNGFSTVVNSD